MVGTSFGVWVTVFGLVLVSVCDDLVAMLWVLCGFACWCVQVMVVVVVDFAVCAANVWVGCYNIDGACSLLVCCGGCCGWVLRWVFLILCFLGVTALFVLFGWFGG